MTFQNPPNRLELSLSEVEEMPGHVQSKRVQPTREQRRQRSQRIIFTILAAVIILSWIASLLIKL
jgi:predicted nucleic acid-binding Zn ribbon protein